MFRQLLTPVRAVLQNLGAESVGPKLASHCRSSGACDFSATSSAAYHTSPALFLGRRQRKEGNTSFVQKEYVADGEKASILEVRQSKGDDRFPDLHLPTREFNGIMFKDLPIVNIKATLNNTLLCVTDSFGAAYTTRSCGYDGFKNARKGTNVAAQATAFTLGKKLMQRGFRTVRVKVSGLGAGRLAAVRGLTFAGVNVVSLTDYTPISWNPPRPRKQRRL
ncbi:30S ribosomal protein S11 [Thrips palmi]|uniref:30S ribosomal protein S11 n=1 Tax=Thrips palmi TaxID=161013 RepID=A0A6P8YVL1_THRPL|nr:30S ribosomal protein S11 [Thrips palmi]